MLLWPGAATSPSAVSKFFWHFRQWSQFRSLCKCNVIAFFLRIVQNHARVVALCVFTGLGINFSPFTRRLIASFVSSLLERFFYVFCKPLSAHGVVFVALSAG